ncbi:MAG: hypothetical protein K8R75_00030 [Deltaproteobacteria bacterium]|jgi:hypothetical protein|nr:hypothetical protein [Deltaproteobacteria bacterium]
MLTKAGLLKAEKPDLSLDVDEDLQELIFIEIASGFVRKKRTIGKLQQIVKRIKEKTSS